MFALPSIFDQSKSGGPLNPPIILLHLDGVNGSTSIVNDGTQSTTFTTFDNAQISTAQSKFGGSSLLLDGNGDKVLADTSSVNLDNDFTMECWVNYSDLSNNINIFGNGYNANGSLGLGRRRSALGAVFYIQRVDTSGIFNSVNGGSLGITLSTGVWYHIAFVKEGSNLRVYLDGVEKMNITDNAVFGTKKFELGYASPRDNGKYFNGYIDEVAVWDFARYTANFTPPTSPYLNSP